MKNCCESGSDLSSMECFHEFQHLPKLAARAIGRHVVSCHSTAALADFTSNATYGNHSWKIQRWQSGRSWFRDSLSCRKPCPHSANGINFGSPLRQQSLQVPRTAPASINFAKLPYRWHPKGGLAANHESIPYRREVRWLSASVILCIYGFNQSSKRRPGIFWKSAVLFVTSVKS